MPRRRTVLVLGTVTALVAGLGAAQLLPGASPAAHAEGLVPYDDCGELLAYYRAQVRRTATPYGFGNDGGMGTDGGFAVGGPATGMARTTAAMPQAAGAAAGTAGSASDSSAAEAGSGGLAAVGNGATGTNLQEQGVDEPDLAKLRDGRLVVLTEGRLEVVTAEADPKVVGALRVADRDELSSGGELLLIGERALLVLPGYRQTAPSATTRYFVPGVPTTRLVLVDLSTDSPRLIEEASYDAQYVSARLVDGTVRLVTSSRPQLRATYPQQPGEEGKSLAANRRAADRLLLTDVLPHVVRTDADGRPLADGTAVSCDETSHAVAPAGVSTMLVTTLRPGSGLAPTDSDAVTTDGDLVYASTDRLYVATSRWGTVGPIEGGPIAAVEDAPVEDAPVANSAGATGETPSDTPTASTAAPAPPPAEDQVTTEIHAFDISSTTATRYLGTGSVPGYVLGRWALSSYDDALRVATTREPPWGGGATPGTSSMVVKLAEQGGKLVETGRLEGLGKGERIQAVRYFGNLAAVVTFRQTDPLYMIDLAGAPRLLGELKVPGFSTYLHPIGDGKLLGLGQEAGETGRVTGAQLSVFDVHDLAHPVQVDRLQLGQGWTQAMQDSRAFTYDPERRLVLFAFQSYEPDAQFGVSVGAVGIHVSPSGQLTEVGRMPVHPTAPTSRVLVDDQHLYAVSDNGVVAGDPATMKRTGEVDFPR